MKGMHTQEKAAAVRKSVPRFPGSCQCQRSTHISTYMMQDLTAISRHFAMFQSEEQTKSSKKLYPSKSCHQDKPELT
jgi:hypothetical protein